MTCAKYNPCEKYATRFTGGGGKSALEHRGYTIFFPLLPGLSVYDKHNGFINEKIINAGISSKEVAVMKFFHPSVVNGSQLMLMTIRKYNKKGYILILTDGDSYSTI